MNKNNNDNTDLNIKIVKEYIKKRIERDEIGKKTAYFQEKYLCKYAREIKDPIKSPKEENILKHLSQYKEDTTRNQKISMLKHFYRQIYDIEDKERLPDFIRKIKGYNNRRKKKKGHSLNIIERIIQPEDYNKLIENSESIKDKAIIETLYLYGIRKGELLSMTATDYKEIKNPNNPNDQAYEIKVRESKTLPRKISIKKYPQYLDQYVNTYQINKGQKDKPLWPSIRNKNKPMTEKTVNNIIDNIRIKAGIKRKIKVHDFRHTSISRDLHNGMSRDDVETKHGLVHGSNQLSIYDHNGYNEYLDNLWKEPTNESETITKVKKERDTAISKMQTQLNQLEDDKKYHKTKWEAIENDNKKLKEKYRNHNKNIEDLNKQIKNLKDDNDIFLVTIGLMSRGIGLMIKSDELPKKTSKHYKKLKELNDHYKSTPEYKLNKQFNDFIVKKIAPKFEKILKEHPDFELDLE
jgi:site-specific recombinase XerD